MAEKRLERRLAAILAADVASYSRLMGVDEEGTHEALNAHRDELVDPRITEHHGRIVKNTGDGVLVEFVSAVDAVRCAIEIQRSMAERNEAIPEDRRIEFRIGINVGDIIIDSNDIFGDGVNIAARLEGVAEPGGITVSDRVHQDTSGKFDFVFEDMGEQQLKNIARPVRVYRVRLDRTVEQFGIDCKFFPWPPAGDPKRPPYRGLRSLEAEDAGIFFGRDAPTVEALDHLRRLREATSPRLLVILGASGAGKSSFLRAGLLPRLARDDRHFLTLPVIRPERAVMFGDNGLLPALEHAFQAIKIATTRADLRAAIDGGAAALRPLLRLLVQQATRATFAQESKPGPPTLLISIDQGEELFLAEGQVEAQAFLILLRDLLCQDDSSLIALITIRSDAYEALQLTQELEGVRQEILNLPPMPKGSYADVIKGPAIRLERTGRPLKLDDSLAETLLTDIEEGGSKDALALLAFTLERLYLEYGGRGQLMLADYLALKGIKGSIEAAVEQAFRQADKNPAVPKDRQVRLALLRRGLIPWLAGIDPDSGRPRRRVARKSEIPEEARPLIDQLIEQRLLATDVARETGEQTIEPVHEALLRQWGLLQGWLMEDSGLLALLEGVKRAARDWAGNGWDSAWLTHATNRLEAAERTLSERPDLAAILEPGDREYVAACRRRQDALNAETQAAQKRKRRLELAFIGVLVVISLAGIAYAIWTDFDNLTVRGEMLADEFLPGWPKTLTAEPEQQYARKILQPGEVISFRECTRCPELIVVPAGKFKMGSTAEEKGHQESEEPLHEVTIAGNFAAGKFEVTFDEWKACVDARACNKDVAYDQGWGKDEKFPDGRIVPRPVINVSWEDAQRYVKWLSARTGKTYRLLSEAEWEYAARGVTTVDAPHPAYPWGHDVDTGNASCRGCGGDWDGEEVNRTAPVGSFGANAFGLRDMHGNVWEWVEDCVHNNYNGAPSDGSPWLQADSGDCSIRVLRGGSWDSYPVLLRSASRNWDYAADHGYLIGFRVARAFPPEIR
jgi:formylglycine-generating enzyme required for sulfatase activity/class 3 adenylate cyclase